MENTAITDERITREEMIELFGEEMPVEAINLLWSAPSDWTLRQLRHQLRVIAHDRPRQSQSVVPLSTRIDVLAKDLAHKGRTEDVQILHQAAQIVERENL